MLDPAASSNLRRLMAVRLLLLCALLPLLALAAGTFGVTLPLRALALVVVSFVLLTLLSWWWLRQQSPAPGNLAVAVQLGMDVAALTAVLYLTGGWTNPLVSLYLVPVAVAAGTLSARFTWFCAGFCVLAYSLLTQFYLPAFRLHGAQDMGFSLHVTGMWITFVVAAVVVAYLGTTMAASLRRREQDLAEAREQNLRNEQILGVAALAAGTAHELSTPLASIAVIASELEQTTDGEVRDDLQQLLKQVAFCRETLNRLREQAAPAAQAQPAGQLLKELEHRFDLLRPAVRLKCTLAPDAMTPLLKVDNALRQALLNLLDNAADVSPEDVELQARWDDDGVEIEVLDRGPGFAATGQASGHGMGLGLLLSNTSIERAGGQVLATPRTGGGTRIRVRLPVVREAVS